MWSISIVGTGGTGSFFKTATNNSIICREDIYLNELVRYIHLDPLRSKVVSNIIGLNRYNRYDLDKAEQRVLEIYQIDREELYSKGRQKIRAEARALFCYWAVRELGYGQAELGRRLGMTQPGVGYAVQRGEHIVKENNFLIEE
jgi:chromosomal replication initiation ATPase DnaA